MKFHSTTFPKEITPLQVPTPLSNAQMVQKCLINSRTAERMHLQPKNVVIFPKCQALPHMSITLDQKDSLMLKSLLSQVLKPSVSFKTQITLDGQASQSWTTIITSRSWLVTTLCPTKMLFILVPIWLPSLTNSLKIRLNTTKCSRQLMLNSAILATILISKILKDSFMKIQGIDLDSQKCTIES